MNILSDIFSVLANHWRLITGILIMMLFGQMLTSSALKLIFRDRLNSEEYFSLGAAGWLLPLSLASILWLAWGVFLDSTLGAFLLLFCTAILAIFLFLQARSESFVPGSKISLLILPALLVLFVLLRLAFVSEVIVPLYFDSAQHYLIIKNLIRDIASSEINSLSLPANRYYHAGFHLLTAWIASTLGVDITPTILILGQVIVAAIPLSLFPIIRQETQSKSAGLFAVLLAAFGWYMPAYAVNWGKYPALTSLPQIAFVMSLAYLSLRHKQSLPQKNYLGLNAITALALLITVLTHSRSIIVFAIIALAWLIATGWQKLSRPVRVVSFVAVLLSLILLTVFIRTRPQGIFNLLFDPYWEKGWLITIVVLFLAIFAQWWYPKIAFASLLIILLLFGSILIPVQVPGYGILTLLDRPFVEMILYLPLSLLGGAGLAGLEQGLRQLTARFQTNRFWSVKVVSAVVIGLLIVNTALHYNLYPVGCCDIVGRDDLVAIDWIDKNLPRDARIFISSTQLRVMASDSSEGAAGGDAGIWITPLTDRKTIPFPYQSDFSQQTTFDALCKMQADYLYVGETGATFNNGLIAPFPDRYQVLLSMPTAKIYHVIGCPANPSSAEPWPLAKNIP